MHSIKSIHKDIQASGGDTENTQHLTDNLHERYASNGRVKTDTKRTRPVHIVSSQESEVYCQLQKAHSGTISGN